MTRAVPERRRRRWVAARAWPLPVLVWALVSSGCVTPAATMAASTHATASAFRSATAYVELSPERAFETAATMLLERGDLDITALDEVARRCTATVGVRTVTVRVMQSTPSRARLTVTVGGGADAGSNETLALALVGDVCGRLPVPCE